MLRNLTLMAMVCLTVCTMTSTSDARAHGRSFKVVATDGTAAGIAFSQGLPLPFPAPNGSRFGAVTVHTSSGDVNGTYNEAPPFTLQNFVSVVNGSGFDNGYAGTFNATVIDLNLGLPGGLVIIVGTGVGTTGLYAFAGTAKN